MKSSLRRLSQWYASQCDGDWEHTYGISVSSLDNPGFALDIDLCGTSLETTPYSGVKDLYDTQDNWMICSRTKEKFEGRCAPSRLEDVVEEFLRWVELQK